MKTLTQHISQVKTLHSLNEFINERLTINKKISSEFRPKSVVELKDYISKNVSAMINSDDNVLNLNNINFNDFDFNANGGPFYCLLYELLKPVKRKDIIINVYDWKFNDRLKRIDCLFYSCECVKEINGLETWDISSVRDFSGLFSKCSNLTTVDVTGWVIKESKNAMSMFYQCSSLKKIVGLDTWKFLNNTNNKMSVENMFLGCINLNSIGNIEYWKDHIKRENFNYCAFDGCKKSIIPSWYY